MTNPNDVWMLQISPNLIDVESGVLRDKRFLIVDRDTKYSRPSGKPWKEKASGSYDCHGVHRT